MQKIAIKALIMNSEQIARIINISDQMQINKYKQDPLEQALLYDTLASQTNLNSSTKSSNERTFIFSGNSYSFRVQSQEMNAQTLQKYTSLRINLSGTQIKGSDGCCLLATLIAGGILIFPLCFVWCDWWKRKVYKKYRVRDYGYEAIRNLIRKSSADELYLMVQDNSFNKMKADILFDAISHSKIKNFSFINVAQGFNCDGSNFSNFKDYMRPFKSLPLQSDISWGTRIVV